MVLQDRAKATRESIIAGASDVFAEYGYGNASLTQVADTAGVTKGALYFHFRSKEELARAVIAEQHRISLADSEAVFAEERSPVETMILMCRSFGLRLVHEPIVKAGIRLTFEATTFGPPMRGPYEDWIAAMEHLVQRGKDEGQIRQAVDPAALSRYIVASFTGVQMVSEVLTSRADVMQRIEQMWAILLPGIVSEELRPDAATLAGLVSA
ncbi:ScbR family autoregulator-binding transcription factor [Arthrobacter sp. 35W]|uniref:ScbR family autoregulator-binding transcription factor n=1 Tax=Arthrobacter sp. 35W TaxID=1132441 RepID=UPI0005535C73|nr:ScbR family autoregulator-binding transcription factor [Arthrobacter sp. 35W]